MLGRRGQGGAVRCYDKSPGVQFVGGSLSECVKLLGSSNLRREQDQLARTVGNIIVILYILLLVNKIIRRLNI